jgi:hypothetical protein
MTEPLKDKIKILKIGGQGSNQRPPRYYYHDDVVACVDRIKKRIREQIPEKLGDYLDAGYKAGLEESLKIIFEETGFEDKQ